MFETAEHVVSLEKSLPRGNDELQVLILHHPLCRAHSVDVRINSVHIQNRGPVAIKDL